MPDGVNQVWKDGRYKLPNELGEKYQGEYLAATEVEDGEIVLKVVE